MRVEVRRRPGPAGAVPTPLRSANANPGLAKAYSDSCFESPTNFYIASPEHPKLGQWAQPSTLKYSQPPQQDRITTQCLNEALLFGTSNNTSRPRRVGCSSRPGRGGCHRTSRGRVCSAIAASSSSATKPSRPAVEPVRAQSPISLTGTTPYSNQAQVAPRVETHISGRVAPLHHRSFTRSTLPASPTLFGSFDRHHHPRIRSAGADTGGASLPVTFDWAAAAFDSQGGGDHPPVLVDMGGASFGANHRGFEGEEGGASRLRHEEEQADEPDVRYRVEKLDVKNRTAERGRARHGERHVSGVDIVGQADPPSTHSDGKALPRGDGGKPIVVAPLGKQGDCIAGDGVGVDVDPWIASQVDPFMSSLREALLRDRPANVRAYVFAFSADCRREKEEVL